MSAFWAKVRIDLLCVRMEGKVVVAGRAQTARLDSSGLHKEDLSFLATIDDLHGAWIVCVATDLSLEVALHIAVYHLYYFLLILACHILNV